MSKGVLIRCDDSVAPEVVDISGLDDVQIAVGGWVLPIEIPRAEVTLYLNEAQRCDRLRANTRVTSLWWFYDRQGRLKVMLMGDVVVASSSSDTDDVDGARHPVLALLSDSSSGFDIQTQSRSGADCYTTRSSFQNYFDALLWATLLGEHWWPSERVRVVSSSVVV